MIQKIVGIIIILSMAAVGYDYFILRGPRYRLIEGLKTNIQQVKADHEAATQSKTKLAGLQDQNKEARDKFDSFIKRLPKKNEIGVLLEQITKIAPKKGIHFDEVSPQDLVAKASKNNMVKYDELKVKIELRGDFSAFGKYLENLEKIQFYTEINSLEIKTSGEGQTAVSMEIKTYILAGDS